MAKRQERVHVVEVQGEQAGNLIQVKGKVRRTARGATCVAEGAGKKVGSEGRQQQCVIGMQQRRRTATTKAKITKRFKRTEFNECKNKRTGREKSMVTTTTIQQRVDSEQMR